MTEKPQHQRILNQVWPDNARAFRDQPDPIDVRARIVWELDGQEILDATAVRWNARHVCVTITDSRAQIAFVWLLPGDVRRK